MTDKCNCHDNDNKKIEKPLVLTIEKIVNEAKDFKTFIFRHKLDAKPGQFIMLWLPRIDEKPFSISYQDKNRFAVTVFKVGPFTEKLFKLKEGDKVGIRGPYGSTFKLEKKRVALVGGGCGTAPMGFLADELKKIGAEPILIIGAKTKSALIYLDRMKKAKIKTIAATDDGSYGMKGFTTEVLKKLMQKKRISKVYACGPEVMLKGVVDICSKVGTECEVSMERYMKCGFGVCGQCCVDNLGVRVCKEGPVFNAKVLRKMDEFGKYKRTASGKKVDLGGKCL